MTKTMNISANPSQPCTFASRISQRTDQCLQKSMSAPTHDQNDRQTNGRKEARLPNIGFAKWRVKCFYDSLVQGSSFVFQLNICAENPPLRKAENRCVAFKNKTMKQYIRLTILILITIPSYCFSQDPSCEFIVTIKNIESIKYDYKILLEYDYKKEKINSVKERLESNWELNFGFPIESSLLKSNSNHEIIIGYLSDYCYPNSSVENQLRIIVARKNKEKNDVELMYALCKLVPSRTEIFIEEFQSGQSECEVFEYHKNYLNNESVDYGHQQYLSLNSRKIYLK